MAFFHWIPLTGSLKINVHGVFSRIPCTNGNDTGIGAIYRTNTGTLRHISIGVLPFLSLVGNQLWAIYAPMRRAFNLGYKSIIIETDNYEAFITIKTFKRGSPAAFFDILDQIDTLKTNSGWICSIAFVFPARNRVARYTARLGMEVGDMLYTLDHAVGGIEELLDWDLGLGVDHPDYVDVHLAAEAPDPVNFDIGPTLADSVNSLGLGQLNAPLHIAIDREDGEPDLDGVQEASISAFDDFFRAVESPLDIVD